MDLFVSKMEAVHWGTKAVKLIIQGLLLDIAHLSEERLSRVQKLMSFCAIQELYVECQPIFQQCVSNSIAYVLGSVPWSMLERLELLGDNIDEWIRFLTPTAAPRLKILLIAGSESSPQVLSPSSVRFVQQLVSINLWVGLCFEDVRLQDQQDWVIIVRSLDPARLKALGLYGKSHDQFWSTTDAVNLRELRLSVASQDRED
ncbi:hypothetical protein CPC16_007332 [Podila verticillata]|nr:hypothetical protein CPC16_007332 [Podila verticillata]